MKRIPELCGVLHAGGLFLLMHHLPHLSETRKMLVLPRPPRDLQQVPKIVHQFEREWDDKQARVLIREEEGEREALQKGWFSELLFLAGSTTLQMSSSYITRLERDCREEVESECASLGAKLLLDCEVLERRMLSVSDQAIRERFQCAFQFEVEITLIIVEAHSQSRKRIAEREQAVAQFLRSTMLKEQRVKEFLSHESCKRNAICGALLNSLNYLFGTFITGSKSIFFLEAARVTSKGPIRWLFAVSATKIQAQWRGYTSRKQFQITKL